MEVHCFARFFFCKGRPALCKDQKVTMIFFNAKPPCLTIYEYLSDGIWVRIDTSISCASFFSIKSKRPFLMQHDATIFPTLCLPAFVIDRRIRMKLLVGTIACLPLLRDILRATSSSVSRPTIDWSDGSHRRARIPKRESVIQTTIISSSIRAPLQRSNTVDQSIHNSRKWVRCLSWRSDEFGPYGVMVA